MPFEQEPFEGEAPRAPEREASNATPESFRALAEKAVAFFCRRFTIEGAEHLDEVRRLRREEPERSFVVASSHLSNLDGAAAVKALGADFNLQMAVASDHFGFTPQELLYRIAGKENFSGLSHKKTGGKSAAVFDPEDFEALAQKMREGKTPWIAVHPFTTRGAMEDARIGAVYLAQKTNSYLLPAALELEGGGSVHMEGFTEITKAAVRKAEAVYHIGTPMALPPIDVRGIDEVLAKRARGEALTSEDRTRFRSTVAALRAQADEVARTIGAMLPERMRTAAERKE